VQPGLKAAFLILFHILVFFSNKAGAGGVEVGKELFSLSSGIRIGASMQEQSPNNRIFDPGLVAGPEISFNFLRLKGLRLGINTGWLFFAAMREKHTEALEMTTRYNRLDFSARIDFLIKAFLLNMRIGSGMMIISTDTSWDRDWNSHQSNEDTRIVEHTGVEPGFIAGLGVGAEVGKSWWKIDRKLFFTVQSDWQRRGNRDELTVWFLADIELFCRKRKHK